MRVLVTGARGQLGAELMRLLESAGQHEALGVDLPECDLTDRGTTLGLVTQWVPDLILHAAAFTAVDRCETEPEAAYAANCGATRFIADGARRVGAHVVYVSTDYVFDGTKVGPYVEWDSTNPQSIYGMTKLGGESEIDPLWTVARTSWLCGGEGQNMVNTLIRLAEGGEQVRFVQDQIGNPTLVQDLAPMLVKLGVERVPGVFHTTNSGTASWYDLAREVFSLCGRDPERVTPISSGELDPPRPAPRPANSVLDNLAWRLHGFKPARDFREPLAEVIGSRRTHLL